MNPLIRWTGCGVLLLAFLLFTAVVVNPMRLGGLAWGGKVEDGRYFVVSKGHHYTEVSETEWRIEESLEWCFFLPVVLVWVGGALWVTPDILQKKPIPPPPATPPPMRMLYPSLVVTALGAGVGWAIGGVPWTAFLGGWLGFWFSVTSSVWVQYRFPPHQSNPEPERPG